jgi:hypothetical protein
MVIRNLDVGRAWRAGRPLKANSPPIIDANAVLAFPITMEWLEPVAGEHSKVFQAYRGIQAIKPDLCLSCETGELPDVFAFGKTLGLLVPVARDHCIA